MENQRFRPQPNQESFVNCTYICTVFLAYLHLKNQGLEVHCEIQNKDYYNLVITKLIIITLFQFKRKHSDLQTLILSFHSSS